MRMIIVLIGASIITMLSIFGSTIVSAQQPTSLSISPLRQEGEVSPGTIYSGELLIKNGGIKEQRIDLSAETFNVTNPSYDYLFQPNTTESRWVSFEKNSLVLKPGEYEAIGYKVSVPINAEPAGYYLALFALNRSKDASNGGITSTERVASLLYLTVSGDASRTGNLVRLNSPVVVFGKTSWSATLQNTGSLHYRSIYSSSVRSVFDNQMTFSEDSRLVLPASVRLVDGNIEPPEVVGLYKVVYSVSLGDAPSQQISRWFLYMPPVQVLLMVLIVIGLIILKQHKRLIN